MCSWILFYFCNVYKYQEAFCVYVTLSSTFVSWSSKNYDLCIKSICNLQCAIYLTVYEELCGSIDKRRSCTITFMPRCWLSNIRHTFLCRGMFCIWLLTKALQMLLAFLVLGELCTGLVLKVSIFGTWWAVWAVGTQGPKNLAKNAKPLVTTPRKKTNSKTFQFLKKVEDLPHLLRVRTAL